MPTETIVHCPLLSSHAIEPALTRLITGLATLLFVVCRAVLVFSTEMSRDNTYSKPLEVCIYFL